MTLRPVKKYRVSYEVEAVEEFSEVSSSSPWRHARLVDSSKGFASVPPDAVIEDITPEPSVPVGSVYRSLGKPYYIWVKTRMHWVCVDLFDGVCDTDTIVDDWRWNNPEDEYEAL